MNSPKRRRMSYFYRQFLVVVGVNVLPLFIMSGVLYWNFIADYKANLESQMKTKISVLADASASSIMFEDRQTAINLLLSLKQHDATRYGQIYDVNMELFAEYRRSGQEVDVPYEDFKSDMFFVDDNIYVSKAIVNYGERLGVIVLSADTTSLQTQKKRYFILLSLVLCFNLLLLFILNSQVQRRLTAPIRELVKLVRDVAINKSYQKRTTSQRDDEVGDLGRGINAMLDTIEAHESELFQRANYDELTHLPNRHLLMERLSHGIRGAIRRKGPLALMFLDLDRFKIINDSLGHRIGDELLVKVANKLSNTLRDSDSISRWGGDEFVILLEDIKEIENIKVIVEKIISELTLPVEVDGHRLYVTTSIGIAIFPKDGNDGLSLLKHADISMYRAKSKGPGQYAYFDQEMLKDSVQRLSLENEVHKAIENKDFFLMYQPQLDTFSGKIVGFEALIRWKIDGKLISPSEFLPLMEEVGLMYELSLWVLGQACKQNMIWQREGLPHVSIAVNLPPSFFVHPNCTKDIDLILRDTGLAAKYLEVEITENTFIDSRMVVVNALDSLRATGMTITIDDFGTGYSCLSYLKDLPVGTLKIDGSFIIGLGENRVNEGIVQSIILLGKNLGMKVVAECVETVAQLHMLENMKCDVIQGYICSKPLTAAAAGNYLASNNFN